MEQKQSVKALLYFAVISVFLKASLTDSASVNLNPQHNINYETLVEVGSISKSIFIPNLELATNTNARAEFEQVSGFPSVTAKNYGVLGFILASIVASSNGLFT